ncbi:MAG: ion transporter, partial [Spirochaetia bacterium]|nr:ion transporter [Spirochaetia bacterium]
MIRPENRLKLVWDLGIFLFTVFTAIAIPLELIFGAGMDRRSILFELGGSLLFAVDIALRFRTAILKDGKWVTHPREVAVHYLKTTFVVDFFAAVPWTLLVFVFVGPPVMNANGLPNLWSLHSLDLLSLLRLIRVFDFTRRLERDAFINPSTLRLSVLIFWMILFTHWIACCWFYLLGDGTAALHGDNYLRALYFTTTTIMTIGYGDITPKTNPQIIFTIGVQIFGAGFYGYLIGNLASILANIDLIRTQFREKVDKISAFIKYYNLPADLQKRIRKYYTHLWEARRGQDDAGALSELPRSLRTEVSLFLNRPIVEKIPFMKGASEECIRDIVLNLAPIIALPNEVIFCEGERGEEMFFISRGTVDVISADGKTIYATLADGNFFGEIALILDSPRTATVRS